MVNKKNKFNNFLSKNTFVVYGLGLTGLSIIKFFKKKNVTFFAWDDNLSVQASQKINKDTEKIFPQILDGSDWILLSPGIDVNRSKFKKELNRNKEKIITDLDLFYYLNPKVKSIVVTGSNGKSSTCKMIEHIFKKNNINIKLGGNFGRPVLNLKLKKKDIIIIEASSFQLFYSKFIRPDFAIILNITNDHLDWHLTKTNYIESKFKIFSNQNKNNYAYLSDNKLIKIYKKKRLKAKLKKVKVKKLNLLRNNIKNKYLVSKINLDNISFAYEISKKFKIKDYLFIKAINSFKGLEHRYELFFSKNGIKFINDSKATSFESSKFAIKSNKNVYWIVGGLPKKGDHFKIDSLKNKIKKAYIIGNFTKYFKNQLNGKVSFQVSKKLNVAVKSIINNLKNKNKDATVLFSPASASYDQFKNFEDRGNQFKRLILKNASRIN